MSLPWIISRLSKMPFPEIPWRVLEKSKKQRDKQKKFFWPASSDRPHENLYLLSGQVSAENVKRQFPHMVEKHIRCAEDVIGGRFDSFGIEVNFESDIDWHFDPVTKGRWPDKFWGSIDYRDKSLGGVKFVWEYNRLYFLFSLGFCYALTKERKYADQIGYLVRSWMAGNPYPVGVNWASGIECGVRLANLVWTLSFLEEYDFAEKDLKVVNAFVWCHAWHLYRYPSRYSSANNHLLAEGFGLFVAGLYFPHLPGAVIWLEQGKNILDAEVERQILADGGSFEYSTTYLSFVCDFFLLYRQICVQNDLPRSPGIDDRLKAACDFIGTIMDAGGNIPNIGDQDSAVLVNFGLDNAQNFSSILNTGALLYNNTAGPFFGPDIKTFLLFGRGGPEKKTDRPKAFQVFESSGLAVIRDRIHDREVLFAGNATPMGMAPLYAHGHLDALSFTLSVGGLAFFVDPGTYLYHSGGKWRTYFRSTAAHNTIRLDQTELSPQTGDFMFGRPYRITQHSLEQTGEQIIWKAGHDAYRKKSFQASVGREVVWTKKDRWFDIIDRVTAKVPVQMELFFHCHPSCHVEKTAGGFVITREDITLGLAYDPKFYGHLFFGSDDPVRGWYSERFNHLVPCFTICLQAKGVQTHTGSTSIQIHSPE
jgi:hypothetical protein